MVDGRALVITPFQQAANRLREIARGAGRHGSCGLGISETMIDMLAHGDDALRAVDLLDRTVLRRKLALARDWKRHDLHELIPLLSTIDEARTELAILEDHAIVDLTVDAYAAAADRLRILDPAEIDFQIRESKHVIFEGAQGVLLDEWHGFHPHTTWSTTTTKNARTLIERSGRNGPVDSVGVMRAYSTRHGQGPLFTESADLGEKLPDTHNTSASWQGAFRVGWLDLVLTRYAMELCPDLTSLAVTCLDRLADFPAWKVCDGHRLVTRETKDDDYFVFDAIDRTRITGLRTRPPENLEYQERLTNRLRETTPLFRETRPDTHLACIEQALGKPITITSYGPTAEDKRWR
jgi:adenylosuccinate synthase